MLALKDHDATGSELWFDGGGLQTHDVMHAAYVYMYMYMYKYMYMSMSMYMYVYIYIYIQICVCIYVCIYIYIHTYVYIYIYICICVYIYIYISVVPRLQTPKVLFCDFWSPMFQLIFHMIFRNNMSVSWNYACVCACAWSNGLLSLCSD